MENTFGDQSLVLQVAIAYGLIRPPAQHMSLTDILRANLDTPQTFLHGHVDYVQVRPALLLKVAEGRPVLCCPRQHVSPFPGTHSVMLLSVLDAGWPLYASPCIARDEGCKPSLQTKL